MARVWLVYNSERFPTEARCRSLACQNSLPIAAGCCRSCCWAASLLRRRRFGSGFRGRRAGYDSGAEPAGPIADGPLWHRLRASGRNKRSQRHEHDAQPHEPIAARACVDRRNDGLPTIHYEMTSSTEELLINVTDAEQFSIATRTKIRPGPAKTRPGWDSNFSKSGAATWY